ncbi:hypothetical protein FQA39_LY12716 [Lamprigera yunnana]|nr:hypothetical protein FQA39_LY12716 [Lamprigera yunnana]
MSEMEGAVALAIEAEIVEFKRKLLEHPCLTELKNNKEFIDHLNAEICSLITSIYCEVQGQKQSWDRDRSAAIKRAQCALKLLNTSMMIHNAEFHKSK